MFDVLEESYTEDVIPFSTKEAMCCRSSGAMNVNLIPIPNTVLSSMMEFPDQTLSPYTAMNLSPVGSSAIAKLFSSAGSSGQKMKTPSTLISLVIPSMVPLRVFTAAGHSTSILGCSRFSILITVRAGATSPPLPLSDDFQIRKGRSLAVCNRQVVGISGCSPNRRCDHRL